MCGLNNKGPVMLNELTLRIYEIIIMTNSILIKIKMTYIIYYHFSIASVINGEFRYMEKTDFFFKLLFNYGK